MNYNDGKWHGWNGGECPVHPETVVDVRFAGDPIEEPVKAKTWSWMHDCEDGNIVAFRVIKEHREPREFWIYDTKAFDNKVDASDLASYDGAEPGSVIHVREVLE